MKKLVLLLVSVMYACVGIAQEVDLPFDPTTLSLPDSVQTSSKDKEIFLPLQAKRNVYIYPTLDMCTSLARDKTMPKDETLAEDAVSSGLSLNFGASVIFVPGKPVDDCLKVNNLGFAYNIGLLSSFEKSEKYDVTCDFFTKIGLEIGNQRTLGIGIDLLAGGGKSKGDVLFFEDIVSDEEPKKVTSYTAWCFKYGGQIWFRTGLLKETLRGVEVLTFAQCVFAKDPGIVSPASKVHLAKWKGENWKFGVMIRYPF